MQTTEMSNEDINMERQDPPSPPNIQKVQNAFDFNEINDPFDRAIQEELLDRASSSQPENRMHRPRTSSSISGYETAPQTPSDATSNDPQIDFLSSSGSSSIPLKGAKHLDSFPEHQLNTYSSSTGNGMRTRSLSDELYNSNMASHASQQSDGLKFYDSDIDTENGSLVFNGTAFRHMSQQSKDKFPSLSSIGTMGSDSEAYHAIIPPTSFSPRVTPAPSRTGSRDENEESFPTPHVSNVTKQRDRSGYGQASGSDIDNNDAMNTSNAEVLPYQARKKMNERQEQLDFSDNSYPMNTGSKFNKFGHGNEPQRQPTQLSTIAGSARTQQFPGISPTYSSGKPPSGIGRNRSYSKENNSSGTDNDGQGYQPPPRKGRQNKMKRISHHQTQQQQHYHHEEDEPSSQNHSKLPSMHLRMESTGSVSSLGSLMDGAASMMQLQSRRLTEKLVRELQEYHDDNIGGSEHLPSRDASPNESRGYLSNFLDNMSVTSGGSLRSIEDERADFRKKSQKIIQKKEKMKQRQQQSTGKGWFPDPSGFGGDKNSMRSLSPANRRSHRPKLPSIDNDTWDEGEASDRKESRSRRTAIKKKNSAHSRPPKQGGTSYGAVKSRGSNDKRRTKRTERRNAALNKTRRISNSDRRNKRYESPSQSSEDSSEDDSCISSDFTSNQFGVEDGEDSSVYVEENETNSDAYISFDEDDGNERTSLLPSGISTDEHQYSTKNHYSSRPPAADERFRKERRMRDDRHRGKAPHPYEDPKYSDRSRSRRSRHRSHRSSHRGKSGSSSSGNRRKDEYSRDIFYEEQKRMERKIRKEMLKELEEQRCCNRFGRWIDSGAKSLIDKIGTFLCQAETFIGNLPLTIGAVALAIVTLGCVWFKFAEEMLDSCTPVHYHSSQCSFPEFPGCFYCDTSDKAYKLAYGFHCGCSICAGLIVMLFFLKICIARKTVMDEMNSPTTSSPAGLMCMTIVCVFAGHGVIGQAMVTLAAAVHFIVAVWFIYMAGAYNILPDPSWYPNTVGIGISAVKTWLYYPMPGHFLMATSLSLGVFFYPISLVRVTCNKKISAPVSWIQMSAPAVSLYAWTIMAQPSFEEEHPDINNYQRVNRILYLPFMHCLFAAAMVGAFSSAQSLYTRWDDFKKRPFSPAHAAFCFPTLAHANSVQAYRGALDSFSNIPPRSAIKLAIDGYWFFVLVCGTIATFIITAKFFYMLPSWTMVDLDDEIEPPAPHETLMSEVITAGETFRQNFVSPAVLQANETGALVQVRKDGRTKYVRTRRVTALGFEPIMRDLEFAEERDALLDWVERNPPRTRKRTLSVPGITTNIANFGSNNQGVYTGSVTGNTITPGSARRMRAQTSDGNYNFVARF